MPLPMIHLAVAREYAIENIILLDCPEYYLGSISPDAIHMRVNIQKNDKEITHLFAEGDLWRANVIEFIRKNKFKTNYDFILGYGIHILTDIIWSETLYKKFELEYKKDPAPVQDIRWAYYNDTDKLDFKLYEELEWRQKVWELLKRAKAIGIEGILNSDEIDAWKNRTLHWFDKGESQHKNPIKYINLEDVIEFIQKASETIKTILKAENL